MPVNTRSFSDVTRRDVFTDKGAYCGKILDLGLDLDKFRVKSLVVDAARGSYLANIVGDKKGVIIPFSMVKSVGDIVLIRHVTPTTMEDEVEREEEAAA